MAPVTRRVPAPASGNRELDSRLLERLDDEAQRSLTRRCPPIRGREGLAYALDGREVVSYCSNDYLGLSQMPIEAADATGSGASRLVCGDLEVHRRVEARFAEWLGHEDAVLFPSGFQANASVLPCLLSKDDRVHSDRLNHASLIDGMRLSAAPRSLLEHLQPPKLGSREAAPRDWWVCESVFSMDGDGPSLGDLEGHLAGGGCLYLDEAHGLGLFAGGRGRGALLRARPTITVAPLGKAFGCAGAFVAGSKVACAWIRSHARGFVFSTGVSPMLAAAIEVQLERVRGPEGEALRGQLWRKVDRFRTRLGASHGQAFPALRSPIHPIVVGSNARALAISARLLDAGWHVQAIRPPTVPEGSARLRVTICAGHSLEQVDAFADDLLRCLEDA